MTAITCAKCNRRFTPTTEEIRAYLAASQGQHHARVMCPHCGKETKVSPERLRDAVRFAPPPAPEATAVAPEAPAAAPEATAAAPEEMAAAPVEDATSASA